MYVVQCGRVYLIPGGVLVATKTGRVDEALNKSAGLQCEVKRSFLFLPVFQNKNSERKILHITF